MIGAGLPFLGGALGAWSQPLEFLVVTKTNINGLMEESFTATQTSGVRLPLKPQALEMKPIGERAWKWENLWCPAGAADVILQPADEIIFGTEEDGERYRVMKKIDYTEYGYIEYEICQGYQ